MFTLLALSVQSASFGSSVVADICEIFAWLLLLIAGVAGLSRLELTPEVFRLVNRYGFAGDSD